MADWLFPAGFDMAKWTRNHMLEIGGALLAVGLILTVISFTYAFADATPSWLAWYADLVRVDSGTFEGNYNTFVFILGPILLIMGGFYFGEQVVLRRRFERLIDTPKRSEFTSRRRDLEDLAARLPEGYASRIETKEGEFRTKRTT